MFHFFRKKVTMSVNRKLLVNTLATIAFVFLFLLPILGFMATDTNAVQTQQTASYSGDYVFFIVQNGEVPLAAAPHSDISSYIIWVALASFILTIGLIYSGWYISIRRNTWELSGKLSVDKRRKLKMSSGFLHPIRAYQLSKEAEATVASMYINY
jgi:hypothetical protein